MRLYSLSGLRGDDAKQVELATWLIDVYKGSPKCLSDAWGFLVNRIATIVNGREEKLDTVVYTILLPTTLALNSPWKE
jgi:hypothetical protein